MTVKEIKKWIQNDDVHRKVIAIVTVVLFCVAFIPLFAVARYAVKSADDYGNFFNAEQVWQQTHSLWKLICYSFETTKKIYISWQGTYFNEFLQGLLGGLCGDRFYFVGAYLTLSMFVLGQLYLFYVVLIKMLGADKYSFVTVTLSCIIMEVLLIPSPVEAFYWFCGGLMYLFPWGISMILVGVCIRIFVSPEILKRGLIRKEILVLLLSVAVAGSNYISLISTLVIWMILCLWSWFTKNNSKLFLTINVVIYTVLSIANILAPGNQNRLVSAESYGWEGYSVLEAILRSLYEAMNYIASNFVLPYVILAVMLVPIFIKVAKNTTFKFRYPLLVTVLSFGVYAAQFTPNLYTLGIIGAYRILNIYKITMPLLIYWLELYWIGCLMRRGEITVGKEEANSILLPMWSVGICIFIFSLTMWGGTTVTSWSAMHALRFGEAKQYKEEYDARMEVLENEQIHEVYFQDYTCKPYILYRVDLSRDVTDWVNRSVADLYKKEFVVVVD